MTSIPFIYDPNGAPPFSSSATLDGNTCSLAGVWNIAAQRWYLTITSQTGNVLWYGPIVASDSAPLLFLAPAVFTTSTIQYFDTSSSFEVTP